VLGEKTDDKRNINKIYDMLCGVIKYTQKQSRALVVMPVILATWEAAIGKIKLDTSLGKKVQETSRLGLGWLGQNLLL
jgi:hypothetical protein